MPWSLSTAGATAATRVMKPVGEMSRKSFLGSWPDLASMPHYVALLDWTEQGIRNVKDTIKRAENAKAMARKLGGKLDVWYTIGEHDIVSLIEMPNDETYNKFALWLGTQGNVRTTSLKAWTQDEMSKLIDGLP